MENILMKTMQATFLLSIACFLGCTSTHGLRPAHEADYVSLNNRAVWSHALVTFVDDRKIQVENLRMTSDSTYWTATNRIATAQIKEVRLISRGKGAIEGMVGGLLLGIIFGASKTGEACPDCLFPITAGQIIFLSAGSGATIGALVGAAIGHRDIYLIGHEAATDID